VLIGHLKDNALLGDFTLKKIAIALSLMSPLMMTTVSTAEARSFGEIYTQCGLGGMLGSAIENKSAGQILAIISNVTWDLGTTAISSQVSSPESCAGGAGAVAAYINHSYEALELDIASGYGEHLDTLKAISNGGEHFSASLRADFVQLASADDFALMSRYEKAESLYNLVVE
jgi:hypothetical protein